MSLGPEPKDWRAKRDIIISPDEQFTTKNYHFAAFVSWSYWCHVSCILWTLEVENVHIHKLISNWSREKKGNLLSSYLTLSYLTISYLILPYLILSYLIFAGDMISWYPVPFWCNCSHCTLIQTFSHHCDLKLGPQTKILSTASKISN